MRVSTVLCSPHWLTTLKATQLQSLARATGIQSSGTKSLLVERIAAQLALQPGSDRRVANPTGSIPSTNASQNPDRHVDSASKANNHSSQNSSTCKTLNSHSGSKPWSILSIDMGIQNLAFAHLHLPRSDATDYANPRVPVLTAWHRLAVSEISSLNLTGNENVQARTSQAKLSDMLEEKPAKKSTKSTSKSKEVETFSPDIYAGIAYNLLKSLLTAYRPTHILIERQRFRSGGASAVQEWTLRVGVFEGMLYAVLHALRMERGDVISVQGVEPKRVVRYWLEPPARTEDKKLNAREVKKAKIDIVGKWISAAQDASSKPQSESTGETQKLITGIASSEKVFLADAAHSPALSGIVGEYMRKWRGESKKRKPRAVKGPSPAPGPVTAAEEVAVDIGKLDDLADCLLQGVAWIEWQAMRERIAQEGPDALDDL
ncbi:DNA-binding SAP [Penicillium brevicompactum]|uniref:DNA-binding SAP n=1 Tax=Penicillium brevicompactum TaxID=5074 RepID=A0A9W9UHW3_PENBR|nr:DNA-binding SAP [Penicillium brevicompactum]